MADCRIFIAQHRTTGLLMAQSPDLPGWTVHAHDEAELRAKLVPAFVSFKKAIGEPVNKAELVEKSDPQYWPPTFILSAQNEKVAA